MKACPFFFVIFFAFAFTFNLYSQGTSRFEIWGLNGQSKEEFIEQYKAATGKDLNYTYSCSADLVKMGYPDAPCLVWVNDLESYLAGKVNWDTTERLAIIRPLPSNNYNIAFIDSINRSAIEAKILLLKEKDTTFTEDYLTNNKEVLRRMLVGLNSQNRNFRGDCLSILTKAKNISLPETKENILLLGSLLSVPDPEICYAAMGIIKNSGWSESVNKSLFSSGAVTLIDFLKSDLRTFKEDAKRFLAERCKSESIVEKDSYYWVSWLNSQNYN